MAFEDVNVVEAHTVYSDTIMVDDLPAGKTLTIETSPSGEELLSETVPEGKKWDVTVRVEVREVDA